MGVETGSTDMAVSPVPLGSPMHQQRQRQPGEEQQQQQQEAGGGDLKEARRPTEAVRTLLSIRELLAEVVSFLHLKDALSVSLTCSAFRRAASSGIVEFSPNPIHALETRQLAALAPRMKKVRRMDFRYTKWIPDLLAFSRCKQVSSLYITDCEAFNDEQLAKFAECFPFLTEVDFSRTRVTGEGVIQFALVHPCLAEIQLAAIPSFNGSHLLALASSLPRLRRIEAFGLSASGKISEQELVAFSALPQARIIRKLFLHLAEDVSEDAIRGLGFSLCSIDCLGLGPERVINEKEAAVFGSIFPTIRMLSCRVDDDKALECLLASCGRRLRILKLERNSLPSGAANMLKRSQVLAERCPQLEGVTGPWNLIQCDSLFPRMRTFGFSGSMGEDQTARIDAIRRLRNIELLVLYDEAITAEALQAAASSCSKLWMMRLYVTNHIDNFITREQLVSAFSSMGRLVDLEINSPCWHWCNVDDLAFGLSACPCLRRVFLLGCATDVSTTLREKLPKRVALLTNIQMCNLMFPV